MQKVVIITGASSGIGYATARLLAQSGCTVYALARRLEKMQPLKQYGVYPIAADVTDLFRSQKHSRSLTSTCLVWPESPSWFCRRCANSTAA